MDLEQWNLAINNASNLWMAGMMTIQTLMIIGASVIAYLEFVLKKDEPKRKAISKLFEFDYLIDLEVEELFRGNTLNFQDPDFIELYSNFPKKYLWSINSVYQIRNKIFERVSRFPISELEKELEIVGNENLRFLFYDKLNLKTYIESDFITANSDLIALNFAIKSMDKDQIESRIKEIFKEIPSHSGHRVSNNMTNYWDTKKEIQSILRPLLREY